MNNGGPAFPITQTPPTMFGHDIIPGMAGKEGMSLRDYFAAKAMLGILQARVDGLRPEDLTHVAQDAYFIADAMLAQAVKDGQ
jgi:hypothetical protein